MDNLFTMVTDMFIDEEGYFYAPNEVEDKFTSIFEAREEVGANDNEEATLSVINGMPPMPTIKDSSECGEAGIAILDEITGDLLDLIGLESLNEFLVEVRN